MVMISSGCFDGIITIGSCSKDLAKTILRKLNGKNGTSQWRNHKTILFMD